jgi:hypothetical protein
MQYPSRLAAVLILWQHAELPPALAGDRNVPRNSATFGNGANGLCLFISAGWKEYRDESEKEDSFHEIEGSSV